MTGRILEYLSSALLPSVMLLNLDHRDFVNLADQSYFSNIANCFTYDPYLKLILSSLGIFTEIDYHVQGPCIRIWLISQN